MLYRSRLRSYRVLLFYRTFLAVAVCRALSACLEEVFYSALHVRRRPVLLGRWIMLLDLLSEGLLARIRARCPAASFAAT